MVMADTVTNAHSVWLTSMKQKGPSLDLEGSALNMDAVADLMSQMLISGYFQNVDLNETIEQPNGTVRSPFNFKLNAQVGPGALQAASAAASSPAPGGAGTRPAAAQQPAPKRAGPAKS
jgi:Tfp pilus assembly protein PilN